MRRLFASGIDSEVFPIEASILAVLAATGLALFLLCDYAARPLRGWLRFLSFALFAGAAAGGAWWSGGSQAPAVTGVSAVFLAAVGLYGWRRRWFSSPERGGQARTPTSLEVDAHIRPGFWDFDYPEGTLHLDGYRISFLTWDGEEYFNVSICDLLWVEFPNIFRKPA